MASIEVSLGAAGARRRSAGSRELEALRGALADRDTLINNLKKQLSASLSAARLAAQSVSPAPARGLREESPATLAPEERAALEQRAAAVRAELDTRRAHILDLRRRLDQTHVTDNIDTRIEQAELQYQVGREELEVLTLGEQARALSHLIEQADAAAARNHRATLYSTVRECGGDAALVIAEARETTYSAVQRGAGVVLEWADHPALRSGDRVLEVNGTSVLCCSLEEFHRAASCAAPARLALLRAAPPVTPPITHNEAVLLRTELEKLKTAAVEAEKTKEGLRTDNTRLTHRISYLEEQVSELLARHTQVHSSNSSDSCITVNKTKKNVTNINITSEPLNTSKQSPKSEVQVFQKGPDITAIVAKLPGLDGPEANLPVMRPRSNGSGASSRVLPSPRTSPAPQHRAHSSHSLDHRAGRGRHSLPQHCGAAADYSAETDAAIRMIERNQRHMEKQRLRTEKQRSKVDDRFRSDSDLDRKSWSSCDPRPTNQKASERIEESIKKTNWAERKTLSIIEQLKRSQRLRKLKKNESSEDIQVESDRQYVHNRIDGKVIENAHKSRRSSKLYSRSAKSSEFESECSDYPNGDIYSSSPRLDYGSESYSRLSHYKKSDETDEGKYRPTPPRKPLRLSLHKAKSAHSLMNGSESETPSRPPLGQGVQESSGKRPGKRSHGADRWARECSREGVRATPRPGRRAAPTLTTCEAPAADRLYPDTLPPARSSGSLSKWC
ncbi:uncharacterized protein LOC126965610 [Leptidea sinapis]|uniref:uncharacterized protein LOC126965610 n=1 Tax=Leptidea sinapis TaxID=189913 RepID=UPI0021C4C029|nr:uncharacterized protein LOC126965610 [Leptidea sinapis]